MGVFICAFTSSGKSTIARKYKNVIDMESTKYKYLNYNESEQSKGTTRIKNPDYPQNYFDELERIKNLYDYILVADGVVCEWLIQNKYEYWQVFPNVDLKKEYYDRCLTRGNSREFAGWLMNNWNEWIEGAKNDRFAKKHIELKSGEFLESVLQNLIKK